MRTGPTALHTLPPAARDTVMLSLRTTPWEDDEGQGGMGSARPAVPVLTRPNPLPGPWGGAAGPFFAGVTSIAYGPLAAAWFPFFPFFSAPFLGLVLSVLLSLGLLLHSIGFLGFWRAYSMTIGGRPVGVGL